MGRQGYNELDELTCPITLKAFQDPVFAEDGHTYERSAITEWIDRAAQGTPGVCRRLLVWGFVVGARRAHVSWSCPASSWLCQREGCCCRPGRACLWDAISDPTISPNDSWNCSEKAHCLMSSLPLRSTAAPRGSC
jgi:hypothetical protein